MLFAWDEWNVEHIARHSVTPFEAELVVETAEPPWPAEKGDEKFVVWGPTDIGRLLQVIFVFKRPDELEFEALSVDEWAEITDDQAIVYVIHAMELTLRMKRLYRRRRRL